VGKDDGDKRMEVLGTQHLHFHFSRMRVFLDSRVVKENIKALTSDPNPRGRSRHRSVRDMRRKLDQFLRAVPD
jgi:hypothetical protein